MKIWKFPLRVTETQRVAMPAGAEILSVKMQKGQLCLWALVSPERDKEMCTIEVHGTGNPIGPGNREYLGTVQDHALVWHVFKVI